MSSLVHVLPPTSFPKDSIGSLAVCSWHIRAEVRIGDLLDALLQNSGILCCVVIDASGAILGKIDREHLLAVIGRRYGREVLGRRLVRELVQPVRVFEPSRPAIEIADELMDDLRKHFHQYFALRDPEVGFSGLVSSSDIFGFLRQKLDERTKELETINRKLEHLSITDGLTNLANRRHFDGVLQVEWKRTSRSKSYLGIAMIDVDHFKLYNDHYGHVAGDKCLKQVAHALKKQFRRPIDLVARYGGEEFVVLCPETRPKSMLKLVESAREALFHKKIVHEKSSFGFVTVSIGFAVLVPDDDDGFESIVKLADSALYSAKAEGRNRVHRSP